MIKSLQNFPGLKYTLTPTPIHKLENLSRYLGANIFCKRDDLTGFAFGGNKTRKLDYLIADAIHHGCDTLIAVGANQSNFCRIASAYAAAENLDIHLVLGGSKPKKPTGNLMLDYLFGAIVHHIDSDKWDDWEEAGQKLNSELVSEGRKVYYLPIGGSTEIGALGYINAMNEIYGYTKNTGIHFQYIFHPSGSAGTQCGLIAGKQLTGYDTIINSIAITENKKKVTENVSTLYKKVCKLLGIDFSERDIFVDANYIGKCYGDETAEAKEAIEIFAKKEGILLDPVYSGKAAAGMIDYIRKGKIKNGENLLFLHTGGNIHLFSN